MLKRKRPDIQIVGDDLHPLGQVQGLRALRRQDQGRRAPTPSSPATGATTCRCFKAANDAGLKSISTPTTPAAPARPTAIGAGRRATGSTQITEWHSNVPAPEMRGARRRVQEEVRRLTRGLLVPAHPQPRWRCSPTAMKPGQVDRPGEGGAALEGMKFKSFAGEVDMRATDHQLHPAAVHLVDRLGQQGTTKRSTGCGWKTGWASHQGAGHRTIASTPPAR